MQSRVYADEYRSPRALTSWLAGTTVATYVFLFVFMVLDLYGRRTYSSWGDPEAGIMSDGQQALTMLFGLCALVFMVVWLISVGAYFRWYYRMIKNCHAIGVRGICATPHGAWLWSLVPFANLVMPFRVMKQIALSVEPGVGDIDHRMDPTPRDLGPWWLCFLLGGITSWIGNIFEGEGMADAAAVAMVVSFVAGAVAAWYLVVLVRRYSVMLEAKAAEVFGRLEREAQAGPELPPQFTKYRGL